MSYTAPQYVDTKEQAVLALASTIADEDKSALGDGSVNRALDVLADTLAGENVDVPQTNAGAILALAQYVGGGGASTTDVYLWNDDGGLGAHGVTAAKYMAGAGSFEELQFEGITADDGGTTVYGVKVKGVPAGALVLLDTVSGTLDLFIGYSNVTFPPQTNVATGPFAPMPIDGLYAVGPYNTDA